MRFCQDHWDKLRAEVEARGLGDLVAKDSATVAAQLRDALKRRETTAMNFDPLMGAHWVIVNNAMDTIARAGGQPLYLMTRGDEDPVTGYGPQYEGRTWPRCPLCYLNLIHEVSCQRGDCQLDPKAGFDSWIQRAVQDQVDQWEQIKPGGDA